MSAWQECLCIECLAGMPLDLVGPGCGWQLYEIDGAGPIHGPIWAGKRENHWRSGVSYVMGEGRCDGRCGMGHS